MAGNLQRWAIAPPALEEDTGELEEFPVSGTPVPDTTVGHRTTVDEPEVEVTFSAESWANDEATGRADPAEQITGVRHAQREEELLEPMDTIPSPPSFGED